MKLNSVIADVMGKWWEQQGKPESGLVFPSAKTGKAMDKNAHQKPWERVKKLAGLDQSMNFYSLRHNFISALVAQGVPMFVVAKLAGHKGVSMIEQHYGHLCPEQAAQAVDILAAAVQFNSPPPKEARA